MAPQLEEHDWVDADHGCDDLAAPALEADVWHLPVLVRPYLDRMAGAAGFVVVLKTEVIGVPRNCETYVVEEEDVRVREVQKVGHPIHRIQNHNHYCCWW